MQSHQLGVMRLGMALGLTAALGMVALGLLGAVCGTGTEAIAMIGSLYYGFDTTMMGILIGAGWGFADGFICGILIAFFYNCCCGKCKGTDDS